MATAPATGETAAKAASTPSPRSGTETPPEGRTTGRATGGAARRWSARAAATAVRTVGRAARAAATAVRTLGRAARPKRRIRLLDVLRVLGLARQAVPHPVVGPKAYVRWWQRILALLVLVAMVVGIGFALAAAVGLMVVIAGFLLEQAIA